jgi:hypothetical protein
LPECLTCQFTRKWLWQPDYPHPANNFGLSKESIALCQQIRTIDKKRMAQEYGHISDTNIQIDIIEAICFQVGIDLTNSTYR